METEKKERVFQTSEIKELVVALSKAQGKMEPAKFNKTNPHYKNKYADFKSCMDACRIPLSENGLSVMQYCEDIGGRLTLVTMLAHVSGQWIKSDFPLIPKNMDSQSIGSAMTYAKRYSLSCMLGIVSDDEDDDGEASHGRGNGQSYKQPQQNQYKAPEQKPKTVNAEQLKNLNFFLEECGEQYKQKMIARLQKSIPGYKSLEDVSVVIYDKAIAEMKSHLYPDSKVEPIAQAQ
jgi:ERF superfamily protein